MTVEQAFAFYLFAVVAAVTPGPNNIMLTATGANFGVLRGLPLLTGIAAGMGVMMFVVAFGLGSLVLGNPEILTILKWCGVAFLLWLSWKIATAGRGRSEVQARPLGFFGAAGFQWVNPKAWVVCAGAVGTYLHAGAGTALTQSALFALLFIAAALPSCLLWLAFGAGLQRVLRGERALRVFNVTMGAVLAASVTLFIW